MKKELQFGKEGRAGLLGGVIKLAKAVKGTLGPYGRNVILQKPYGPPVITKDGVTVAKDIELTNPLEKMGATLIREVAVRTNTVAGDGTTTATVLAEAIFKEGISAVTIGGANPMEVQRGILDCADSIVDALKAFAIPVKTNNDLLNIATVSANWDTDISTLIAEAMSHIGTDGMITVEESPEDRNSMTIVPGMRVDKGFISPIFINNPKHQTCVIKDAYVLLWENAIRDYRPIVLLLNEIIKKDKSLLIIADSFPAELTQIMLDNLQKGVRAPLCLITSPAFGERRSDIMDDIAAATGTTSIKKESGTKINELDLHQLGHADVVTATSEYAIIQCGERSEEVNENIAGRLTYISTQMKDTSSEYEKEKLQERRANLASKVAILSVGAATDTEKREKRDRVEDAINATQAAVEEGIVPGGGSSLITARRLMSQKPKRDNPSYKTGWDIVCRAITAPARQIADNAGQEGIDGNYVVRCIQKDKRIGWGYNIMTNRMENLIASGVIDPVKVTRCALQYAASIAGLMLTTDCISVYSELSDDEQNPIKAMNFR